MHNIEPHYLWQHLYKSEEDEVTPFYQKTYSELYFSDSIYNYVIHPQWDNFGSPTLYLKVLYADYIQGYCIIEFIGEWNDCIHNDIMTLKRELIDVFIDEGITHFILIGEMVLNFHASDDSYYEEWFSDIEGGWIALVNFRDHVLDEIKHEHLDYYLVFGGDLDQMSWRKYSPMQLFTVVNQIISRRIGL